MSKYITKVKTDVGEQYCLYNDTTDTIDSPFFTTPEEIAEYLGQNRQEIGQLLAEARDAEVEFSISIKKIPELLNVIADLKEGKNIDNEDIAKLLSELDSLIVSIINETEFEEDLANWIEELGLSEEYPENYNAMDIFDECRGNVCFGDNVPTSKQNQLIGRYFEKLLQIIRTNDAYEDLRSLLAIS